MGLRGQDRQIDNIEFNVGDIARSKAFYGSVFGWTFTDYGPSYTEFSDGRLTGGFTTGEAVRPGGPLVILYADDLAETQQRVEAAGAAISRPVFAFPGGRRFHFIDPDGHELAVWSAADSARRVQATKKPSCDGFFAFAGSAPVSNGGPLGPGLVVWRGQTGGGFRQRLLRDP